jgi:lysosomal alpha-mannosidase
LIVYNNWTSEEFRLYDGEKMAEIEWIVGPIPVDDNIGKEIIMRYDTDIASMVEVFIRMPMDVKYLNGKEIIDHHGIMRSINYYSIASRIWVKDNQRQLTILTGRNKKKIFCSDFE